LIAACAPVFTDTDLEFNLMLGLSHLNQLSVSLAQLRLDSASVLRI